MKNIKKLGLDKILNLIKSGMNPSAISKKYNIPKQTLDYSVGKLKKLGCIEKVGYGTWNFIKDLKEVPKSQNLTTRHYDKSNQKIRTSKKKEIRGHAFIWKIEFVEPYDWNKIIRNYKRKKLTFQLLKHNKVWRTIFQNRKIWLGIKGMTIYEPLDFFGRSSFEVKGRAVFEMDLLIKNFLRELNLKFRPYRFSTSREHYGIIKNELARQYNDRKQKMQIRSEDGTLWMWIDDSKSLGELENAKPNISRQVQNFWNNHKKHDFRVDADFVIKGFNQAEKKLKKTTELIGENARLIGENAKNQAYHAENLRAHVQSIKDLGAGVETWIHISRSMLEMLHKLNEKLE